MGMMAKMRGLAPAFIITVGALFVLFMVISDSNVMEALGGRTNNVGSVDGEDISYQEFVNAVDQQRENQKKQFFCSSAAKNEKGPEGSRPRTRRSVHALPENSKIKRPSQ